MWGSKSSSDRQRKGKSLEGPNFAQTCNLLSRYVKEKGSLRDLNLEIGGKVESLETLVKPGSSLAAPSSSGNSRLKSMGEDPSNKASTSKNGDPKTAQMVIFYSGKVLVFDDYPADKVKDLVHVAKKGSSQMSYGITIQENQNLVGTTCSPREGLPPRPQAATSKKPVDEPPPEGNGSDLPIARRSSLHRFLAKWKDRAAVREPSQNQENLPSFNWDEQLDLNNFPNKD